MAKSLYAEAPSADAGEQVGYGSSPLARESALGSEFHQRMLAISIPRTSLRFSLRDKLTRRGLHKLLHVFVRHHGLTRLRNLWRYLRQRERVADVGYMPPLVVFDVHNRCNLRCPGCATGLGIGRERGAAELGLVRQVIDQVSTTALQFGFFHWGEPLLNLDTYAAIEHASGRGLWTTCSSNLSFKLDKLVEPLFRSGLHDLVISCDGVSQVSYEKYRQGGDVELVFENLRRLRARRDELGRRTPYLRMKMIVFEHNWHEIEAFRDRSLAAGADEVAYAFGYGGESYRTGENGGGHYFDLARLEWVRKEPGGACTEVWKEMFVGYDGAVFSCCLGYRDSDLFSAPVKDATIDVRGIWNNESYRTARRFFLGEDVLDALPEGCKTCKLVTSFDGGSKGAAPGGSSVTRPYVEPVPSLAESRPDVEPVPSLAESRPAAAGAAVPVAPAGSPSMAASRQP